VTLLWGILLFFILPDTPATAWFLTRDDHVKAVERVRDNMTGIKNQEWKREQMIEALRDPKVWLTVITMLSANIPNGGVGNVSFNPMPA
jgi:MFS transporter, ACS family, allantoate permease